MTRRNKSKVKTRVKAGNALLHGAGASTWQDRGSLQQGAIISKNPYYNNDYYRRWQDWVRWYYTDWAARKVVDIPINDAFRVEPQLKGMDEDTTEALLKYQEAMGGRDKLRKAATQERLLGGSLVLLGIRQQDDDVSIPLDYEKIDKGDLVFMNVVSVEKISQVEYETDPFSPMFNTPKYYMINGRKVHISRLIVFDGNPLFNIASMNILQNFRFNPAGFGESVLTTLFDSLVRFAGTQEGAYHLVNMASVLLVKCDRLLELQSTNLGDRAIEALNRMAEQISIYRAGIMQGKDMEITQHSATFGSVPELLQTFAQILAAGSDIPATRFLGQAPGGLNATGESDLENYYNNIASWQNIRLKPRELQMYDIMGRSCFGREKWLELKPGFDIEYAPLWNLSETEQATVDRTRAETIDLLANAGYLSREKALDELKARKIFVTDIEAEDMPDMSELGYMSGYGEQPNTPEQNNDILGKMAQIGNLSSVDVENAEFKESEHPRDEDGKFTSGGSQQKSSSDVDLAKEKKKEFNRTLSDLERNLKKDEDARKKYAEIALKKPSELLELGLNTSRIDSMKSWLTKNPDYIPEETRKKYQKEQEEKRKMWDDWQAQTEDLQSKQDALKLPKNLTPARLKSELAKNLNAKITDYLANTGSYYINLDFQDSDNKALQDLVDFRISLRDHVKHSNDYVNPDLDIFIDEPNSWQVGYARLARKLGLDNNFAQKVKQWDEYDDKLREIEAQKSEYRQKENEKANDIDSKYPF